MTNDTLTGSEDKRPQYPNWNEAMEIRLRKMLSEHLEPHKKMQLGVEGEEVVYFVKDRDALLNSTMNFIYENTQNS